MKKQILKIDEPVIALNINRTYKDGMSAGYLYDCTRGIWRVSLSRAENAELAFSVYQGEVKEVYAIQTWHPEGSTKYKFGDPPKSLLRNRFEFIGKIAADSIRDKYLGKEIPKKHSQNPIKYFNCK